MKITETQKWFGVLLALGLAALMIFFYPLRHVLAPSSMSLKLNSDLSRVEPNTAVDLNFSILDKDGELMKDFEIAHEKLMHVIVVRDDLQNFQHLHPDFDSETGAFSTSLSFPEAGIYTVYADFVPLHEENTVLHFTVDVAGDEVPVVQIPNTTSVMQVGPLTITPHFPDSIVTGEPVRYSFDVTENGQAVYFESYLGALGHSVIIREEDMDYLHTHPDTAGLSFETSFLKTGLYKAFTQFMVDGQLYEIDVIFEVGQGSGTADMHP